MSTFLYCMLTTNRRNFDKHYRYRNGPVPFTACRKWSHHSLRYPRTLNEKRGNDVVTNDGFQVKIRAKRNSANLPDAWDDYPITSRRDRNWKNYRLTRYKTK